MNRAIVALGALAVIFVACGVSTGEGGGGSASTATATSTGGGATCAGHMFPHANVIETDGGQCEFTACDLGWDNCDGNVENGCETNATTANDCGACGNVCHAGEICRQDGAGTGAVSFQCVPEMCPSTTCDIVGMACGCEGIWGGTCGTDPGGVLICCTGCIDAQGNCQPGTDAAACGTKTACAACSGTCSAGVCQ